MARHGQQIITEPIILSIELSGMYGSFALTCKDFCLCETSFYTTKTHSKNLIAQIDHLVSGSETDWQSISAIALSIGPGSFTGLRIALSTAKALCMAYNKKIIGIPTLDALARQVSYTSCNICPILDARKKEVYSAFYRYATPDKFERVSDYAAISPEQLVQKIDSPTIFIGDGTYVYGDLIKNSLGKLSIFQNLTIGFPKASTVGLLALEKYFANDFMDPMNAAPLYVRASDAELNFKR